MNAQFFLKLGAVLCLALRVGAQESPTDLFDGRDLNRRPLPHAPDRKWIDQPISRTYYSLINPGRSLLLYDCGGAQSWCRQKDFSFETISGAATRVAGETDLNKAASSWYTSGKPLGEFSKQLLPWDGKTLQSNPFQLLAVVNRIDLAKWNGKAWTGAEIRFVYGPKPTPPTNTVQSFTLILEFTLPETDGPGFWSLAQSWFALSKAAPDKVAAGIGAVIKQGTMAQSRLVRLRVNHETGTGPWQFAEWDFGLDRPHIGPCDSTAKVVQAAPANTFAPAPLKDQIKSAATQPETSDYQAYRPIWEIQALQSKSSIDVPPCLYEPETKTYENEGFGMQTLIGICNPDSRMRNILALQQCSFCHTTESGTNFSHIQNRAPNANAKLSQFLTGAKGSTTNVLPPIDRLFADPTVAFEVAVSYKKYTGPPACTTLVPAAEPSTRSFHDLARRGLFLSAVLLGGKNPSASSIQNIESYGTNFAH